MKLSHLFFVVSFCFSLGACAPQAPLAVIPQAPLAVIPARKVETQKFTLGTVQLNVRKGVSSAEVITFLSSPNIVTTSSDGTETWIFDKIMTEEESVVGVNGSVSVKSTRTMMVVIKFDKNSKVDTVQYRQTSY